MNFSFRPECKEYLTFSERRKRIVKHTRFVPLIAATFSVVACFATTPIQQPIQEKKEEKTVFEPTFQPQGEHSDATPRLAPEQKRIDEKLATQSVDAIPPIVVDKPEIATASIVSLTASESENLQQTGAIAAVEVRYSQEVTSSQSITLTLQLVVPQGNTLEQFALFQEQRTQEGFIKLVSIPTEIADSTKSTIRFTPKTSGLYKVFPKEKEPQNQTGFPQYNGSQDFISFRYDPSKDALVSDLTTQGFHDQSNDTFSLLDDDDIASFSVDFVPGDGHEKETGDYHALRFFRYAFQYSGFRNRVRKEVSSRIIVHDTRPGIDATAELYNKRANVRIGFSRGALVLRANSAILRKKESETEWKKRKFPLHFYGDISLAGAHLGIKAADPKWWRAGVQGRRYATLKQIAYTGFWHNFGTPMNFASTKNTEDPIRDFNISYLALGHLAFFPPSYRYPVQPHSFFTMYSFGPLGGIPVQETLSTEDSYSIPCSAASDNFSSAAKAVGKIINGECRYNFIDALEWMEKKFGASSQLLCAGFFSDIAELRRAQAGFEDMLSRGGEQLITGKDRSAETTRNALLWLQSEQALMPYGELAGDGMPDLASALMYRGTEPLLIRNGNSLAVNNGALEKERQQTGIVRRVIKDASHADFSGMGSDNPREYSSYERAVYDQLLIDIFTLRDNAMGPAPARAEQMVLRYGMPYYLGIDPNSVNPKYAAPEAQRIDDYHAVLNFDLEYRYPYVWASQQRIEHCTADFRWYNGHWWFDRKLPRRVWIEKI
ncbi:hypothetical protein HY621_03920 [Candidatus Uhrbacteria bacterium]|nr:hypothetical protein [Candidatus Uhrbacteria bacterium]